MNDRFDDIRPYTDAELPAAMQRIVSSEYFPAVVNYIYPGSKVEDIQQYLLSIKTIEDFQLHVMYDVTRRIIDNSIEEFTFDGFDALDRSQAYLFVSNHRDIMLDSLLLQYALYCNNMTTSEITFGENLMKPSFVVDIGKCNKMFKVYRSGSMREFMEHSQLLSDYIRDRIVNRNTSIWIAQRNGRTKNGLDATDQGLSKMFSMSSDKSLKSYQDLHIAPMSISYEIEPCDGFKTQELYVTKMMGSYTKQPGEDLNSVLTGIQQPKGRVHLSIAPPITLKDFEEYGEVAPNQAHKVLTDIINKRIKSHYKLFPNNYIAYDMRSGGNKYAAEYNVQQKEWFEEHFRMVLAGLPEEKEELESIFLDIYANSVD